LSSFRWCVDPRGGHARAVDRNSDAL
jgi:hypothetical protein